MDVSVIIPVFNDVEGLASCIGGLATQDLDPRRFEVIVVDNGPTDGAETRLNAAIQLLSSLPNGVALHELQKGSYAARNRALQAAKGRVLAFTDADCIPEPNWLAAGLAYLNEHPDVAAAGGSVKLFARDPNNPTGAELYDLRHGFQVEKYIANDFFGVTANLFVRRATLDAVGHFDASLRSGGDKEWGARLKEGGLLLTYVPEASVRHPARRSIDELRAKAKRVVRGDATLRRRQGWSRLNWLRYTVKPLRPPLRTVWLARRDPLFRSRSQLLRYSSALISVRWMTTVYRFNAFRIWGAVVPPAQTAAPHPTCAVEPKAPAEAEPPT